MKYLMVFIFFAFISNTAIAQTTDNCTTDIIGWGELTVDFNGATDSGLDPGSCVGSNDNDQYARGIVDATGNISLTWNLDDQGAAVVVTIYTGTCGNLTEYDCHYFTTWSADSTWYGTGFTPGDTVTYRFTAGNANIVAVFNATGLPLNIISFEGTSLEYSNKIELKYANTNNVESIEIERSKNGKNFFKIGKKHIENTKDVKNITFIDNDPYNLSYYRIKIIDFDGMKNYSDIILVNNNSINPSKTINIYPNPVQDEIHIYSMIKASISIYNQLGVEIKQLQLEAGSNSIDFVKHQSGLYFIRSENGDVEKFVKR